MQNLAMAYHPRHLGQRYLITSDIPAGDNYWGDNFVKGDVNDIIEVGEQGNWFVAFDSSESHDVDIVTNNYTDKKLKWDGEKWFSAYEGVYNGGFWRLYP